MERVRRKELDGLRGVAALIVLVAHVSNSVKLWNGFLGYGTGKVGVMIFFCLSGYLMGALYLNRKPSAEEVFRYGLHRMSRIAPLFLALVFVSLICGALFTNSIFYGVHEGNLLQHLTFQRATGVMWTIPVEVQFYACFVALWFVYSGARWAFLLLCAALIPWLWNAADDAHRIGSTLLAWAPYFLVGLLVSRLPENPAPSRVSSAFWSALFIGAAASCLVLFPQIALEIGGPELREDVHMDPWHNPWSYLVVGALLAATVRSPLARKLLGNAPMIYAGAISYSVYLLHMPVIVALKRATPLAQQPELFLLAATVLTGLIASASFYLFEDPVRRRLNAWGQPLSSLRFGAGRKTEAAE
jgi:peptidoglycan/LPS O-acetylase OafA/YrhL